MLELRQQYSFYGIFLYIISTIFIIFLTMPQPQGSIWMGMFWVIQLFICINAVAKSFLNESRGQMLYYYSVASPMQFIVSKLLFNTLLMLVMSLTSLLLFTMFLGNPFNKAGLLIGLVIIGGWSFSLIFTFLSAIAAGANQNAAIIAVLGFPIIIPQILMLIKISKAAFSPLLKVHTGDILLILALDGSIILLSIILYPFLWRE